MYLLAKLARNKTILAVMFALALSLALGSVSLATIGATCTTNADCGTNEVCTNGKCAAAPSGEEDTEDTFGLTQFNEGVGGSLGNQDLRKTVGSIINVALSLLGVVAVVIILLGGFKWMTSSGNEEKATEARKLIFAGIIGLAIILSAWAIALFVLKSLSTATGSGTLPTDL